MKGRNLPELTARNIQRSLTGRVPSDLVTEFNNTLAELALMLLLFQAKRQDLFRISAFRKVKETLLRRGDKCFVYKVYTLSFRTLTPELRVCPFRVPGFSADRNHNAGASEAFKI